MKNRPFQALTVLTLAWFTWWACSSSKQSAAPAMKPATQPQPQVFPPSPPSPPLGPSGPSPSPSPEGPDLTPNCDKDKDFHQLDFPERIKDCLKTEKMFNFDKDECTKMNKAAWDKCDFDTAGTNITDLGLSKAPMDAEKSKGGKLIGCGASNNGYVIVLQFFHKSEKAEEEDCSYSKQGKVVSVCFQKFLSPPPPIPNTAQGKEDYVASCLNTTD